ESGARGFFPVSGIVVRMITPDAAAPSDDLNGDGRLEPWELNRLLGATLEDGRPIQDSGNYTLATMDFLVTGGDDMGWAMDRVPQSRKQLNAGGLVRDAIVEYLGKHSPVNTVSAPLVDSA